MSIQLDLVNHDPEEFEGKLISWHDVDYVIGAYVGSGASKIVHELINSKSGLRFYLIKIWRNIEEAHTFVAKNLPLRKFAYLHLAPPTYQVFANGGAFEIQGYLGPYQDEDAPTTMLMKSADEAIDKGELEQAGAFLRQALEVNPFHTGALINFAHVLSETGQPESAVQTILKALRIDPNVALHYRALFQYAGSLGYIRACRDQFEVMKSRLFLEKADYEWGIDIYLTSGAPAKAQALLAERQSLESEKNDQELSRLIENDLAAEAKATVLLDAARKQIGTNPQQAIALFDQVRSVYLKDPFAVINVGLAFQRMGEYDKAAELLLSMVYSAPLRLVPVCLANAAFCATGSSDFEKAVDYFAMAMKTLSSSGEPLDPWDAPGVAMFVSDESTMEQHPAMALEAIETAMAHYRGKTPIPASVRQLAEMYRMAAAAGDA
jgi:tetratricopeptide (TPR) repeat protein